MNKLISILAIAVLLTSSIAVLAAPQTEDFGLMQQDILRISDPIFTLKTYTEVSLTEATSYTSDTTYRLPAITKTYTYPLGTTIDGITITPTDTKVDILTAPPMPAPTTLRDDGEAVPEEILTCDLPACGYTISTSGGRIGNELRTILTIKLYPSTYDAETKELITHTAYDIDIAYTPAEPTILADDYDLVILSADNYATALQPLVEHKNSIGITTKLVTLGEISDSTYFPVQGRDCAEKIKYFLKSALDEWGIEYCLLVGGRTGGIKTDKWSMPVRYSNLDDGGEADYLTDLYYACLYDEGGNFSDWDPDGDGIYAEWTNTAGNKEEFDMYPDIAVGRIPCRYTFEVKTIVEKIITYETTAYGSDWAHRFLGISGDTYPNHNDPYYEGELATQVSYDFLEPLGYTSDMIWTSTGAFTGPDDVIDAISQGAGFIHFSGHGSPAAWSNHPPQDEDTWIDGPRSYELRPTNKDENPIVIVGGCHNAQFNVGIANLFRGMLEDGISNYFGLNPTGNFWYMEWVPYCWSWALVNKGGGGGISIIANTGFGYGIPGEDWNTGRGRWMEMKFFESYADGHTTLGDTFNADLVAYLNEFPAFEDKIDTKIVQQWVLLGDPSLQIGGVE